ncbi:MULTISPECIES: hypothetical protein [Catenuloplanes]|uniref:Uncharacterized protein n=1 Tax=Catenuloplanes niger TaxID=587534 RepID=A0AAE4CST0_9ACTN|nr:hypothetical protein [Catenuloplanes niger]MDR7322632.1 hypothetical protein [Catenuloplanes niger]
MAHDLALYLLVGGYRLLYGGSLEHGAVRKDGSAPGDDMNYVRRLMDLVERHTPMSEQVDRPIRPIVNHVPLPWHVRMSEADRNFYRRDRANLIEGRRPEDPRVPQRELDLAAADGYRETEPLGRYPSSLGLTRMRTDTTDDATARVALGGKLTGYLGVLPGVAEEVLLTLEKGRPVYLLGAFGGATRAVVDVLRGDDRPELTEDWCAHHVKGWSGLFDEYRKREHPLVSPEEAADELRRRGAGGLAAALNNGLTDDQNDELATTTDPWRAVELILTGLRASHDHEPR